MQLSFYDLNKGDEDKIESDSKISKENLLNPAILKDLPFDTIYESARKEASRKKPVFFIHKYFARRITANFRLILLGLLLPRDADIYKTFYESPELDINNTITLLDPFMGGGTTLFESERINTKTIGNDLQPLSKFVTEALLKDMEINKVELAIEELEKSVGNKIKYYYKTDCPDCNEKSDVMYNFHVKTIESEDKYKHRLFNDFILSIRNKIYTIVCPSCFDVFESGDYKDVDCPSCEFKISNAREGYVKRGIYESPKGDFKSRLMDLDSNTGYPFQTEIIAQEYCCSHCNSKGYKKITDKDISLYNQAKKEYRKIKNTLPIPHQKIPEGYNTNQILNHGYYYFKDLFNERQLLSLGILLKEIEKFDEDVKIWLLLAFSDSLEMNNMFCRYQKNAFKIGNVFFNHAYVPITMPVENNVWGAEFGTGTFLKTIRKIIRGKQFNKNIYDVHAVPNKSMKGPEFKSEKVFSENKVVSEITSSIENLTINKALLTTGDSQDLNHIPNESVDVVLTDPPYGSNVMYSELIDFFHVWLHKSSYAKANGFSEPLSPKVEEILVNKASNKTYEDYENGLTKVFKESNRVMKEESYLVFSFHDKDLESWYSVISSLINSEFKLVEAYPMHSETRTGSHTSNKNSIAFDIFLICKKNNNGMHKEELSKENIIKLEKKALNRTSKFIERLFKVDAELTLPDIENIFLSQFFSHAFDLNIEKHISSTILVELLADTLKELENVYDNYIVEKRVGWWSELHKIL